MSPDFLPTRLCLAIPIGFLVGLLVSGTSAAGLGSRSPAERATFVDEVTGITVTRLTSSSAKDDKIYQTHPNWTADGSHLVFHSDRSGHDELFALEESSGEIVQLTDQDSGAVVVCRHENALYLVRDDVVYRVDLEGLLADSKSASVKPSASYRQRIAELSEGTSLSGTFTEDADGKTLYFGLVNARGEHSIRKLDVTSGQFTMLANVDFRVGHCQAHPTKTGVLSYCQETGGDTAQRMWIIGSDGSRNRPFYTESYGEWVTHEVWWTPDRMLFTIWPKDEQMKGKPHGIASVSLSDFSHRIHDQYPYWHVCGTPDGRFAIGDTFAGELFMIDIPTGQRQLLTQGHRPDGATSHQHQSVSPDGRRVLFVSSKFGNWDLMTVNLSAVRAEPTRHGVR